MALELIDPLRQRLGSGDETDAPARHGVGLADTIDDGRALLHAFAGSDGGVGTDIVDMLIDFIGDDYDIGVTAQDGGEGFQLGSGIDGARGVGGRAEDEGASVGRNGLLQLFGRHLEVLLNGGLDKDGLAISHQHHLGIADPIGGGNDDLIAGIDEGEYDIADSLLGTIANDYLRGLIGEAILAKELIADGLPKRGIARHGAISGPVVIYGLLGSSLDVVRSVEVGLTHTEVDDVDALSFQFGTLLRHSKSGRGCKAVQSFRKAHIIYIMCKL